MVISPSPPVLVVEDDQLILLNSRLVLESAGYHVIAAQDAGEALVALDGHPEIAALLTDITMPGPIDGLTLARRVHDQRPALPVFVISGSTGVRDDALPPSARFLGKPYTAAQLLALLSAVPRTDGPGSIQPD